MSNIEDIIPANFLELRIQLRGRKKELETFYELLTLNGDIKFEKLKQQPFMFVDMGNGRTKCVVNNFVFDKQSREDIEIFKRLEREGHMNMGNPQDEFDWVLWRIVNWGSIYELSDRQTGELMESLQQLKSKLDNSKDDEIIEHTIWVSFFYPLSLEPLISRVGSEVNFDYKISIYDKDEDHEITINSDMHSFHKQTQYMLTERIAKAQNTIYDFTNLNDFIKEEGNDKLSSLDHDFLLNVLKFHPVLSYVDIDNWCLVTKSKFQEE